MQNRPRLSLLEVIFILIIALIFYGMISPASNYAGSRSARAKTSVAVKSIGLTMVAYAEDDIRSNKMPYPLPEGQEKVWGNSKDCWSTSVAEMLFKQKYMKKGEESQLKSAGAIAENYKPMYLNDKSADKNNFWNQSTELDFHLYCENELTSNYKGRKVLVATYDNDDIRNCQFDGSGWVLFFSDKTTEFVKRNTTKLFDIDSSTPIVSLNKIEGSISGPGIVLRKDIPKSEGGPGTFGNMYGGGSTELMGKNETDAIYKKLVR